MVGADLPDGKEGGMRGVKSIGTLAVAAVVLWPGGAAGDWKGDVAKRVVGRAVREGLEDALKDAALDATLDTVVPEVADYTSVRFRDVGQLETIGEVVTDGVDTAMRVADVADTLDDAVDAARTARKIGKAVKVIKR